MLGRQFATMVVFQEVLYILMILSKCPIHVIYIVARLGQRGLYTKLQMILITMNNLPSASIQVYRDFIHGKTNVCNTKNS